MRIRSIKPEWLEDERLLMAGSDARTLSISLLLLADDYGRGRAHPALLGARVFPCAENPRICLEGALEHLVGWFVELYEVRGQQYFAILNWSKHQKVDRPGKPHVPAPEEAETEPKNDPPANNRGGRAKDPGSPAKDPGGLATDQDQDQDHDHLPRDAREAAPPEEAEATPGTFGPIEVSQLFQRIWRDHWPDHWLQIDTNLGRQRKRTRRVLAYAEASCTDGDLEGACIMAILAFVQELDADKIAGMNDPWAVFASNPGKSLADRRAA